MSQAASSVDLVASMANQLTDDYLARLSDEVAHMEGLGFAASGSATPDALLVKGALSDEERAGGALLGGADGVALRAALRRLGYADDAWAALSSRTRGEDGAWSPADPDDLGWAIEALDPEVVIACDDEAARAVAAAWDLDPAPETGTVTRVLGRRLLTLGGFADALGSDQEKRVMWNRLKLVPALGEPF